MKLPEKINQFYTGTSRLQAKDADTLAFELTTRYNELIDYLQERYETPPYKAGSELVKAFGSKPTDLQGLQKPTNKRNIPNPNEPTGKETEQDRQIDITLARANASWWNKKR